METQATKRADDVRVGDFVVERDGCEWQVAQVEPCGRGCVRLVLANVHHYMSATAQSVTKVRATALVRWRSAVTAD